MPGRKLFPIPEKLEHINQDRRYLTTAEPLTMSIVSPPSSPMRSPSGVVMADRIGIVAEGRLMQVGTPREIYGNPANLHVAARLGQPHINLLPADLLPGGGPPPGTKTVGARTEHLDIIVGKDANAEIDWIEHLGDQNHLHIRVRDPKQPERDHKLVTLADPYLAIAPGDRISLTLRDPLYFDAAGQRLS